MSLLLACCCYCRSWWLKPPSMVNSRSVLDAEITAATSGPRKSSAFGEHRWCHLSSCILRLVGRARYRRKGFVVYSKAIKKKQSILEIPSVIACDALRFHGSENSPNDQSKNRKTVVDLSQRFFVDTDVILTRRLTLNGDRIGIDQGNME